MPSDRDRSKLHRLDFVTVVEAAARSHRDAVAAGRTEPKLDVDERLLREELQRIGRKAGVPSGPLDLAVRDALEPTDIVRRLRQAMPDGWAPQVTPTSPWLVLAGGTGAGKTCAAAWALLRGTLDRGQPGLGGREFVASRHVAERNAGFSDDRRELDALALARWLVLDDLGSMDGGRDGHAAPAVQRVLTDRYEKRKPTLITTNLAGEAMARYIGERLTDRLREISVLIGTGEKSLRKGSR
jgi:hypothetical protein